ncbi:hypothetical protein ACLKMW_05415 [Pseudaminobacter sp. NGMCC 1.201702]
MTTERRTFYREVELLPNGELLTLRKWCTIDGSSGGSLSSQRAPDEDNLPETVQNSKPAFLTDMTS